MRTILMTSLIGLAAFVFFSCADDSLPENSISRKDALLQLKSVAVHSESPGPRSGTLSEFVRGDTIGLFLQEYYSGNPFVFAARENYWWQLPEPVFLGGKPVRLLAYYPYRHNEHAYLSQKEVNVEHTSQTDYMHGHTMDEYVSREHPYADIVMKHVLAMIQFKFIKNGYPHDCSVQRVSVNNADGVTLLKSRGILNLESGQVEPLEGHYDQAVIMPEDMNFYEPYTSEEEYVRILVIPTEPTKADGDLLFEFEIDGHIYTCPVRAGTCWQAGMKYTYEVEMTPIGRSLKSSVIPGDIHAVLTQTSKQ